MNPTKQIEQEPYEAPVLTDISPVSVVKGDGPSPNGNDDEEHGDM